MENVSKAVNLFEGQLFIVNMFNDSSFNNLFFIVSKLIDSKGPDKCITDIIT